MEGLAVAVKEADSLGIALIHRKAWKMHLGFHPPDPLGSPLGRLEPLCVVAGVAPRIWFYARSELRSMTYSRLVANLAHPTRSKAVAIGALATSVSARRGLSPLPRASRSVAVPAASRSSTYPCPLIWGTTPT